MATINKAAFSMLATALRNVNEAAQVQTELNAKREGIYVTLVKAALISKTGEVFGATCETFMQAVRDNAEGLAVECGAPLNKAGDAYTVPGSFSSAKTVLVSAYKFNVEMGTAQKPRPFTQIRDAVVAANRAEQHKADPLKKDIFDTSALCDSIKAGITKMSAEQITELHTKLREVRDWQMAHQKETDAKAASVLAEAAAGTNTAGMAADGRKRSKAKGKRVGKVLKAEQSAAIAA